MSTIGFLDYDLTRWQQPITFNLELMKMVRYHKDKRDLVAMLESFDDSKYARVIVRKDYDDGDYSPHIFNNPKTLSGGLVFMQDYSPMDIKLESLVPDPSIYERMKRYYNSNAQTKSMFKTLMSTPHARLSLDGKTIWTDWRKQLGEINIGSTHGLILHDKNIANIHGAGHEVYNFLQECHPFSRRLGLKFPLEIKEDNQFNEWSKIKTLVHFSDVRLMKRFSDEQIFNSKFSRATYVINNKNFDMDVFFKEEIQEIFLQLLFCEQHNKRILLKIADETSVSYEWKKVVELINMFLSYNNPNSYFEKLTVYYYTKRFCPWLKIDKINIFDFVRNNNLKLFKLLYECSEVFYIKETSSFESRWEWKVNGGKI